MKIFKYLIISVCILLFIAGCKKPISKENEIKIGTIAGPESDLMYKAAEVAKERFGLDVKVVEFEDYIIPNMALADGNIDANMFQHEPYLEETIQARHYALVSIGKMFIFPMGLYSKKITTLDALPMHAKIAVPNDPSNETRALKLLEEAKLIKLNPAKEKIATIADITSNPKSLTILEIDAAQLPRALDDVYLSAINTNYAIPAGLYPKQDALFIESSKSPYVNIVVVRDQDKNNPKFKKLMDALHSDEIQKKAEELFKDQAINGW